MTPWEICSHKIFTAMKKKLTMEYQHLPYAHFSLFTLFFVTYITQFLYQGKGMSRQMIWSKWRHEKMNRSPKSPSGWWVIKLVNEMWAECNNFTLYFWDSTGLQHNQGKRKRKLYSKDIVQVCKKLRCKPLHAPYWCFQLENAVCLCKTGSSVDTISINQTIFLHLAWLTYYVQ